MRNALARLTGQPKALIAALVVAALVALVGGAAFATKSAGDHFADATFEKLGGDSDAIIDAIADKVVAKVSEEGGTLDSAQAALVTELAGVAGAKLEVVDAEAILDGVKADVVAAGLGKIDTISTDEIVQQVTAALVAQAKAEIEKIDIDKLAKSALDKVAKNVDIDKLVEEQLAKIDVEKLITSAITKQLGGGSGGSGGGNWLSLLFR